MLSEQFLMSLIMTRTLEDETADESSDEAKKQETNQRAGRQMAPTLNVRSSVMSCLGVLSGTSFKSQLAADKIVHLPQPPYTILLFTLRKSTSSTSYQHASNLFYALQQSPNGGRITNSSTAHEHY
jgi:hypothetical protein